MICYHCNTPNEPGYQFCVKCGQRLDQPPAPAQTAPVYAAAAGVEFSPMALPRLGIATARILIILFSLWLAKTVLLAMPFVKQSFQPGWEIQLPGWISLAFSFLFAIALLFYASEVWGSWPEAFRTFGEARTLLAGAIILVALPQLYRGIYSLVITYDRSGDGLLVLNLFFLFVAIGLILWMLVSLFQGLPVWLLRWRSEQQYTSENRACQVCGAVNPLTGHYCGSCGAQLG